MGFFYRTIRMVENGIKPMYVFDGKPPELKAGVVRVGQRFTLLSLLTRSVALETVRAQRRSKGGGRGSKGDRSVAFHLAHFLPALIQPNLGTAEDVDRFARRTVKVTREHNEECRRLLGLMGIPFVVVRTSHCFQCSLPHRGVGTLRG